MLKKQHIDDFAEIFKAESLRGDIIHWNLHWFLYGIILLLSSSVYFIQHIEVGKYGILLSIMNLLFNSSIAWFIYKKKSVLWIRYVIVSLNVLTLTMYNFLDGYYTSSLAPVTTAALLLYPVIIFLASLRMDKYLIMWATILSILAMDGVYFWFYPSFDPIIAKQLVSADILGQVYRTVYLAMCGVLMYSVPRTMHRMLIAQQTLAKESQENKNTSLHDSLTGISNRLHLEQYLKTNINNAKLHDTKIALFFIDLDGFKDLNDTYGHDIGDFMLKSIAKDLSSTIRESDIVARIGGDEFVVVTSQISGYRDAEVFGNRIHSVVTQKRMSGTLELLTGASIGVSVFPDDSEDLDQLIKHADEAMYRVKKSSKQGIRLFKSI